MMPGMDGFEVCSLIKKNPVISEIPIILITAITDSESIIKGFETGAVDYITKPFIKSELLIRVKTQIEIKKGRDEIARNLKEIEYKNKLITYSIQLCKYNSDSSSESISEWIRSFSLSIFALPCQRILSVATSIGFKELIISCWLEFLIARVMVFPVHS